MPFSVGLLIPKPLLQVWKANADGTGYAFAHRRWDIFSRRMKRKIYVFGTRAFKHAVNLYSDAGTFITLLCAQTYLNLPDAARVWLPECWDWRREIAHSDPIQLTQRLTADTSIFCGARKTNALAVAICGRMLTLAHSLWFSSTTQRWHRNGFYFVWNITFKAHCTCRIASRTRD